MSDNERQWEKWGQIVLVILLLSTAFRIGMIIGGASAKEERGAVAELRHALEVIDAVDVENVDAVCESFDAVMDDIQGALCRMGYDE